MGSIPIHPRHIFQGRDSQDDSHEGIKAAIGHGAAPAALTLNHASRCSFAALTASDGHGTAP